MNVAERDAARAVGTAVEQPQSAAAPAATPVQSRKLRPLISLMPYIARYRWRATAALVALLTAAVTTLVVPVAVRRMIDFGFSRESASLIDSYFAVMIAIVAVLALASAARFYLVTRWASASSPTCARGCSAISFRSRSPISTRPRPGS